MIAVILAVAPVVFLGGFSAVSVWLQLITDGVL